jgi:serine-threonine kinase receptor-associated protein
VATGGQEKKLQIFDLSRASSNPSPTEINGDGPRNPNTIEGGHEVGAGEHTGSIKSIVWNVDYNILTTAADDKTIRWYDLRTQKAVATYKTDKDITSCELSTNEANDINPGIISVAAGQHGYFFDAGRPGELVKQVKFDHEIASIAINPQTGKFVTGGRNDTWVRVWDFEPEKELGKICAIEARQGLIKH